LRLSARPGIDDHKPTASSGVAIETSVSWDRMKNSRTALDPDQSRD